LYDGCYFDSVVESRMGEYSKQVTQRKLAKVGKKGRKKYD
jgi:hypothetical protein